jgi:hypothetical protein
LWAARVYLGKSQIYILNRFILACFQSVADLDRIVIST